MSEARPYSIMHGLLAQLVPRSLQTGLMAILILAGDSIRKRPIVPCRLLELNGMHAIRARLLGH